MSVELSDDEDIVMANEGRRAPSLYLRYKDHEAGDILVQDVYVPRMGMAKNTYYCCIQWNAGTVGGGYCGIQDHPEGRNYIFSLWDPPKGAGSITAVHVGPGTICVPFGGEDTGMKTYNFTLGWEPDQWYTLLTKRWAKDGHSLFGFWVYQHSTQKWTHMVTLDYPVPDVNFKTSSSSFLEDWVGNGEDVRRVRFRNGYKHNLSGGWMPFSSATFSVVHEAGSRVYANAYDTGVLEDTSFYLQAGGNTIPTEKALEQGGALTRHMDAIPDSHVQNLLSSL